MKKFALPVLVVVLTAAMLAAPALAEPKSAQALAQPAAQPGGTASPRNWDKLAPAGDLLGTAVKADSAVLMDEKTGKVLYQKNADKQEYPASTTKIMTCLLAVEYIESGHDRSELITVGTLPKLEAGASKISLKKGETMSLIDMLNGLMVISGNDAANAIGIYIGGTLPKFVDMMNAKAKELGMTGTHYMNPNGLHDPDHYTTALDMAVLTREARRHPLFTDIVDNTTYKYAATNVRKAGTWEGHNALLDKKGTFGYMYATGVKTGYTSKALHTYVSSAKRGGMSLISVVMRDGQSQKWTDAITMFEYGFNYFDTLDLTEVLGKQTVPELEVKNAAGTDPGMGKLELEVLPQKQAMIPYITDRKETIQGLKDDLTQFQQDVEYTKDTAPIAKDEPVGMVTYTYQDKVVLTCELLAARDVKEAPTPAPTTAPVTTGNTTTTGNAPASVGASQPGGSQPPAGGGGGIGPVLIWVGAVVLLLAAAVLTIRIMNMQRRNRKHSQYNYRQGGNAKMRR